VLPEGHTGSSFFLHVLQEAAAAFPHVLERAQLPGDPRAWKRDYRDALVRFEAARVASDERVEIARLIAGRTQAQLGYASEKGRGLLAEHLSTPADAPVLELAAERASTPGLVPAVPFEGRVYRGREILELCERFVREHQMTHAALAAARFIIEYVEARDGALDLSGERFALLGAGAELAPTPLLLRAGARVLWVDVAEPRSRVAPESVAGELLIAPGARDILRAPREVAAALTRFGEDGPIHVGMFAYAAGASQEWRLGAAMNAIVRHLPPALVRSLALLVSPTMPASVQPEDAAAADDKLAHRPRWQALGRGLGALPTPGRLEQDGACISRSIVSIQGLSYQAAQYVSKVCAAESFALYGVTGGDGPAHPVTVSANVAGITNTRSLAHPLFQAAFIGAPSFDVRIFQPETTRALSGLLVLSDLLNPDSPGSARVQPARAADKARGLLSQQVHGGIYSLPYELEAAIRVAAVLGMARKPSVLWSSRPPPSIAAVS
jgi:hypothetical protein